MAAERRAPDPHGDEAKARALADRVLAGEQRAASRLMRLVDDDVPVGLAALAILHREGPECELIGVTGAPGAGKSTLIDQLIAHYRAEGKQVGVVAVDPSSPRSGGAVLADRVRMQRHTLDEGVFVRSLAARGATGGLSASASATARILEAMGFDVVILETVGIGQSEVDIAEVADTVLAVLAPGMGDDVQAMKAGLLEIPDVFVVNKADRDGADRVVRDLELMVHLQARTGADFVPPVVKTVAARGEGIRELAAEIERHRTWLIGQGDAGIAEARRGERGEVSPSSVAWGGPSGEARGARPTELARRRLARARLDLEMTLLQRLRAAMFAKAGGPGAIAAAAERVARRESDREAELEELLARILG